MTSDDLSPARSVIRSVELGVCGWLVVVGLILWWVAA